MIVNSSAQNTFFMGTVSTGGSHNEGTLFRTDSVGMNLTVTANAGVYIIEVCSEEGIFVERIVKN